MDSQRICPSCQKPLAPDVPLGLCPECLIKAGFAAGTATGSGVSAAPPIAPLPPLPLAAGRPDGSSAGYLATAPAIGLMIYGGLKVTAGITACLVPVWLASWFGSIFPISEIFPGLHLGALIVCMEIFLKIIPGALIIYGGAQMLRLRSHTWAVAAAMLSILSILQCGLLGLVIGIWAMIVLSRGDVREAFYAGGARPRPGGGNPWVPPGIAFLVIVLFLGGMSLLAGAAEKNLSRSITKGANSGWNFGSSNNARQNISFNFPLAAGGSFSLDNVNGKITITGWDQDHVAVQGVKSGPSQEAIDAVKTDVDADTNQVSIHTRQPDNHGFHWGAPWFSPSVQIDYTIQVPWHTRLKKIADVNGKVSITGVDGDIDASTVNGEAVVRNARHDLRMETVNGRISAELARLGAGQSASFETVNGAIAVTLPRDANSRVSASTVNGGISSDFSSLEPSRDFPLGSHLNGRVGNGDGKVHAETVNGAIHFEQAHGGSDDGF